MSGSKDLSQTEYVKLSLEELESKGWQILVRKLCRGRALHGKPWAPEADARGSEPVLKMEDLLPFYGCYG